jgi:hypothetical protein
MAATTLHDVESTFQAVAETVVPELATEPAAVRAELLAAVERALAGRPPRLVRQLAIFLRLLDVLARLRFGRRLARLDGERRTRLLTAVQDAPVLLLRRGFWGLRTLILLGWYTRPAVAQGLGYRAHPAGWSARGLPDEATLATPPST